MGGPVTSANDRPVPALMKYKPSRPDPAYPLYFPKLGGFVGYASTGGAIGLLQGNFCKVLRIKAGTTLVKQDIIVEPASRVQIKIRDAEGRPLSGARVSGIGPGNWMGTYPTENDTCWAYDVEAGKPRLLVFYEPTRRLVGTLTLKGDEKGPVVARLGPAGSVRGQLLSADGKPLAGEVVLAYYTEYAAQQVYEFPHHTRQVVTDARGTFRVDELVGGVGFKLYLPPRKGASDLRPVTDAVFKVEPGRTRDLGALKLKAAAEGSSE
jgi:hypothetical protein